MAKKALINREAKRVALAKKYAAKRAAIFAVINDAGVSDKERFEARLKKTLCFNGSTTWHLP